MYLDKIRAVLYHRVKTARICYLLLFFSGLWQYSGRFGDHGSRSSQKLRSVSSICFGISVRRYSKYSYGLRLFTLVVSAILYILIRIKRKDRVYSAICPRNISSCSLPDGFAQFWINKIFTELCILHNNIDKLVNILIMMNKNWIDIVQM